MKTADRARVTPEGGHSTERLAEDRQQKAHTMVEAGPTICQRCGAVSFKKHWFFEKNAIDKVKDDPLARAVTCPGCQRVEEGHIEGEVILDVSHVDVDREMLYGTVYHIAARAFIHNPLSRVAVIQDSGNEVTIRTTTRSLTNAVGRGIHKAFKGKLEVKSSPGDRLLRMYWSK